MHFVRVQYKNNGRSENKYMLEICTNSVLEYISVLNYTCVQGGQHHVVNRYEVRPNQNQIHYSNR